MQNCVTAHRSGVQNLYEHVSKGMLLGGAATRPVNHSCQHPRACWMLSGDFAQDRPRCGTCHRSPAAPGVQQASYKLACHTLPALKLTEECVS